MDGKLAKLLKPINIIIIIFCLLCLIFITIIIVGKFKQISLDKAIHQPGYTWVSSNPDIWFIDGESGMYGEFNYNGKLIKIAVGTLWNEAVILVEDTGGDPVLENIVKYEGRSIICLSIHSFSKIQLVYDVVYCSLPDFNEKQIVFVRKDL